MATDNTPTGMTLKLSEIIEQFQGEFWSLLILERDLTLMQANTLAYSKEEITAKAKQYRDLSLKIFGHVRPDRQT